VPVLAGCRLTTSFLPLVGRPGAAEDERMLLLVVAVLMLLAWATISFGPTDDWRRRC
jgi:hypothetical protein